MKVEVALGAPAVAVAGAKVIFGYSLPEWAAILTCVYTALLILRLLYGWFNKWSDRHMHDEDYED